MPMRYTLRAIVLAALTVATVHACPKPTTLHARTAMSLTPPPSHAAVVAWKTRPWTFVAPTQGLVVSIDPVDGVMGMPASGELDALARVGDDEPVATYRRANGSVRAMLDDRFADFAVVQIGSDGKPAWTCVHGSKAAAQFMTHPVAKSRPAPERAPVWEDK